MTHPILNLADVPLRANGNGSAIEAQLGRIGGVIGAQKLGCQLHVVAPGKKAFPFHAHHVNEEMILVLEGSATIRIGAARHALRQGDVVALPPGDASAAHQIINTSDAELRYLCFSTRLDPDVVEYPDSNKFAVTSGIPQRQGMAGATFTFTGRLGQTVDYFDGEH